MSRYRHVFFDLDHTLWDFRTNSRETLRELHADLELENAGIADPEEFVLTYEEINARLWRRYESGRLERSVLRVSRFHETLKRFGLDDAQLARTLGHEYIERCPKRSALNPGVLDLLRSLHGSVGLHVITNGFQEVQEVKLLSGGIRAFFSNILTSERAGANKPDPVIFAEAMRLAGTRSWEAIMVGDDVRTDMQGARDAGMDQAHFVAEGTRPDSQATYRFSHFRELGPVLL